MKNENSSSVVRLLVSVLVLWLSGAQGMVNHLPTDDLSGEIVGREKTQQAEGLNSFIAKEFAGVSSFPFWSHIGRVGMGTGVYLGEGQVLTSAHVGCYPFQMQDGSHYSPDYASWRILRNSDGGKSDLAVFRVRVEPHSKLARLGRLAIGDNASSSDSPVVLLGTGYVQSDQPLTVSSQGRVMGILGYQLQPNRGTVWGVSRNVQLLGDSVQTGKFNSTSCFATLFERAHFAGQAADGDSGGAAFRYNRTRERWELVGCIIAVSQPGMSVSFGCRTFLGDLSIYKSQIPQEKGQIVLEAAEGSETLGTAEKRPLIQARPVRTGRLTDGPSRRQ